ncbi:Pentapeptide repeats (8 copies) [Agathobacter rectalis M104/1]|uniref:pentapeptide repeat-containing protein n=1 Tax=Agathobacter rectalis TaxID=39491 RepID=UPI0001CD17AD|nr:pentapeptide repeat-containing protein [Agathobacter rectalis]CBK95339.1 Pentapeptide repeats (8 copies) [Agathobacter rectalis M104/1]
MAKVKGFKVFHSDWTCSPNGHTKQYTCPGKFEEEGELDICSHGMHFCQTAADCFNYYSFNSENKVAEVIAYGDVSTDGDKSCTDKLEIVREIPWDEVLRIVNIGKNCTGRCNTGDYNTGYYNTGDYNTGYYNTGDYNTGYYNTGDYNTGYYNTGDCNTRYYNTGDYNTGNCNTGDRNTGNNNTGNCNVGDRNTGSMNTGDWNTGNCNTGYYNTGYGNTGDYNTGDWNKSSFNTGCFNTEEQKIMLFNKPSDITYREWIDSDARDLLNQIPKDVVEWVDEEDMTDEEKAAYPTYETIGGYLKTLDESESGQLWWNELSDCNKQIIKSIPNFDPDIFYECTGIKVTE